MSQRAVVIWHPDTAALSELLLGQVEFGLPDLESRTQIFQIHTRTMNCERDIRYELLARCVSSPASAANTAWATAQASNPTCTCVLR